MPQMAPLSWLTLMMFFIMVLLTFNIMNYFLFTPTSPSPSNKLTQETPINWKW